jgi:hypothetical protein
LTTTADGGQGTRWLSVALLGGLLTAALEGPGPDPNADYHPVDSGSIVELPATLAADPVCRSEGRRFVVVYAYPAGGVNGYAERVPTIRDIVRRANGKLLHQSRLASRNRVDTRLKVQCQGRAIQVAAVPVTLVNERCPLHSGCNVADVVEQTLGEPYEVRDGYAVKYIVFYDQAGTRYTGVGYGRFSTEAGSFSKTREQNLNWLYTSSSVHYPKYWYTHNTLHEIAHSVGAVQTSNRSTATRGAHCVDGNDTMCYPDFTAGSSRFSTRNRAWCPTGGHDAAGRSYTSPEGLPFDCGFDTYFDPIPHHHEYLAHHWNLGGRENEFFHFARRRGARWHRGHR